MKEKLIDKLEFHKKYHRGHISDVIIEGLEKLIKDYEKTHNPPHNT